MSSPGPPHTAWTASAGNGPCVTPSRSKKRRVSGSKVRRTSRSSPRGCDAGPGRGGARPAGRTCGRDDRRSRRGSGSGSGPRPARWPAATRPAADTARPRRPPSRRVKSASGSPGRRRHARGRAGRRDDAATIRGVVARCEPERAQPQHLLSIDGQAVPGWSQLRAHRTPAASTSSASTASAIGVEHVFAVVQHQDVARRSASPTTAASPRRGSQPTSAMTVRI